MPLRGAEHWEAGRAGARAVKVLLTPSQVAPQAIIVPGSRTASQSQVGGKEHSTVRDSEGYVSKALLRPPTQCLALSILCHNCSQVPQRMDGREKALVIPEPGRGRAVDQFQKREGGDLLSLLPVRLSLGCYGAAVPEQPTQSDLPFLTMVFKKLIYSIFCGMCLADF